MKVAFDTFLNTKNIKLSKNNYNRCSITSNYADSFSFSGKSSSKTINKIKNVISNLDITYNEKDFDELMNCLKEQPFIEDGETFVNSHYDMCYCIFILSKFFKEQNKDFLIETKPTKNGFEYIKKIIEYNKLPFEYINLTAAEIDEGTPIDEIERKLRYVTDGTYDKRKEELEKYSFVDEYDLNSIIALEQNDYERVVKSIKQNSNLEYLLQKNKAQIKGFEVKKLNNANENILELVVGCGNIDLVKVIYPDGKEEIKRIETRKNKGVDFSIVTELNSQNKYLQSISSHDIDIEFLNDDFNSLSKLMVSKNSSIEGLYDTVLYNLLDYSYDRNILDDIFNNSLEGGQVLSKSYKKNGFDCYKEKFSTNGYNILRSFVVNQKDEKYTDIEFFDNAKDYADKKFDSYFYNYFIKNENGDEILKLKRKFLKLSDAKTKTIINGKTYIADFDDEKKVIKIHCGNKETIIDINKKIDNSDNIKIAKEIIWEHLKNLPCDLLLNLEKYTNEIIFDNESTGRFYVDEKDIEIIPNITTYAHELGHAIDHVLNISSDEKLIEIYKKELENFENRYTYNIKHSFEYFSAVGGGKYANGLGELVAEVNALLTFPYNTESYLRKRMQLLAHNFPQTVSYIASKLGLNSILE